MAVEPVEVALLAFAVAANVAVVAWSLRWARSRLAGEVRRRGGRLHGMRYRPFAWYRGWDVTYTDPYGRQRTERMVPMGGYVWQATGEGAVSPGEAIGQTLGNPGWWTHPVQGGRPGQGGPGGRGWQSPAALLLLGGAAMSGALFLVMAAAVLGGGLGFLMAPIFLVLAAFAVGFGVAFRRLPRVREGPATPAGQRPAPAAPRDFPALPRRRAEARGRGYFLLWIVLAGAISAFAVLQFLAVSAFVRLPPWMLPAFLLPFAIGLPIVLIQWRASHRAPPEEWRPVPDGTAPAPVVAAPADVAAAWPTLPRASRPRPSLDEPWQLPTRRRPQAQGPRFPVLQLAGGAVALVGAVLAFGAFLGGGWPALLWGVGLLLLGGVLVFAGS